MPFKIPLILLVLFGSVGCDQVTKIAAREHLMGREILSYFGDMFRLTYAENHGAFLGMGSSLPASVRTLIFTILVGICLLVALVWLFRAKDLSKTAIFAVALVIGGG